MKNTGLILAIVFVTKFAFSQNASIIMPHQKTLSVVFETVKPIVNYKTLAMLYRPEFTEQKSKNKILSLVSCEPDFNIIEKNGLLVSKQNYSIPDSLKFMVSGKSYTYNGEIIKASKMYKIMLSKNDPELHKIIKKAKIARGVQYAGFGGIYMGAGSIAAFALSALLRSTQDNNNVRFTGNPDLYFAEGIIYGVAALALGTTGIVFHIRHKKLKARAVSFYNEKY